MPRGPIRRAQMIAPFGPGATSVLKDGTIVICAGLDHWYERQTERNDGRNLDTSEYQVEEWRLQRLLKVDHFRLPPDYRRATNGVKSLNVGLTIPFLRFPQWHACVKSTCNLIKEYPLTTQGRQRCEVCKWPMQQVRFIAVCDHGHIQDFPWREWVHRSVAPQCKGKLRLYATGGVTLAAQIVACSCGAQRSLVGFSEAKPDNSETNLSFKLDINETPYLCSGRHPWLGHEDAHGCGRPLRGSFVEASNVYFSQVKSALYLPKGQTTDPELVEVLENPPVSTLISTLTQLGAPITPTTLRVNYTMLLSPYSDTAISTALSDLHRARTEPVEIFTGPEDPEVILRRQEFAVLREPKSEPQMLIEAAQLETYDNEIMAPFAKLMLVRKLRETRAFAGFSRLRPEAMTSLEQRKALLRRTPLGLGQPDWLPATVIYGEGLYLELNEEHLQRWERETSSRVEALAARFRVVQQSRQLKEKSITPRFVLIHTFAHLLINRLIFECGYSAAALRERLYVSNDPAKPMAGLLIYTAAGDSEGTMGGLVRMGQAGYLEPVIRRAIEGAQWCSADPVCREMGHGNGQGPDGCNLAACHNCALLPETSCEQFNRFLDRALVVGDPQALWRGFFGSHR